MMHLLLGGFVSVKTFTMAIFMQMRHVFSIFAAPFAHLHTGLYNVYDSVKIHPIALYFQCLVYFYSTVYNTKS